MRKVLRRLLIPLDAIIVLAAVTIGIALRGYEPSVGDRRARVKAGLSNSISTLDDQSSALQTTDIRRLLEAVSESASPEDLTWFRCPLTGSSLLFNPDNAVWARNLGERRWDSDDILVISPTLAPSDAAETAVYWAFTASARFIEVSPDRTPPWLDQAMRMP